MDALPFDQWLSGYIRWKTEAAKLLGQRLPSEVSQLVLEKQQLEPMRFEAEGWRSDATAYYYRAKLLHIERLQSEAVAKTALSDMAKAQSYRELWARENAHGVAEAVISRSFKVDSELKRLDA
jgi:hypothetical protein